CSLAGNDGRIIVAVDVSETLFFRNQVCVCFSFAEIFPVKNNRRSQFLAIVYFNERGKFRHHHCRGNTEQFALISERLSVIAGGRCDDPARLLVGRQLRECIARTAFLKTSCALQVVELAENFHTRDFAERDGGPAWRIVNCVSNAFARRFDLPKCDHEFSSRGLLEPLPIAQWESEMGCNSRNPDRAGGKI